MDKLQEVADLIQQRNVIDAQIGREIGRPALIGHIGEWLAARIFNIILQDSASHQAIDGYFQTGALAGKSVNIKWYGAFQGVLDITTVVRPDYYLVLTGLRLTNFSSKGQLLPLGIANVFLFESTDLIAKLQDKVKIGIATSVRREYWDAAEIYPTPTNPLLPITDEQRAMLALFAPRS